MYSGDCSSNTCFLSPLRNVYYCNNMPIKKTVYVLDNELRLRLIPNSSTSIHNQNNIGRFDELTHFFNIINGLFHQSAFTLGLSTYHLTPLLNLPEMNVGVNMYIDQQSLEQNKIDFLKNMTFYSLIGRNELDTVMNNVDQQNIPMGIIKFHTFDKNLMLSINHRWTPSFITTFRVGTIPQKRLWSHIEYRRPNETYELISEYRTQQYSSNIQFSYLSCLWKRINYQIDGGIDIRINSKEKLADIGLRLKHSLNSIVFKCNLYHPFEHYLISIQRCINTNFTMGLIIEKMTDYHQQPIKFSLMSQWHLNKIGLRINTLINTQNELGLAITHQFRQFPFVLQTFGLYSWTTHKCKWGIGLQLLL